MAFCLLALHRCLDRLPQLKGAASCTCGWARTRRNKGTTFTTCCITGAPFALSPLSVCFCCVPLWPLPRRVPRLVCVTFFVPSRFVSSLSRSLGVWALSSPPLGPPCPRLPPSRSLSSLAACPCLLAPLLPVSVPPARVRCNRPACPFSVPLAAALSLPSCLSSSLFHRVAHSPLAQQWRSLVLPRHPHGLQGAQLLQRCLNRITAAT